jgi:hypothetical protein
VSLFDELRSLAERELRRRRRRACHQADGTPKINYRTRRAAKAKRLKFQTVYSCPRHGWHIGTSRKTGGHGVRVRVELGETVISMKIEVA